MVRVRGPSLAQTAAGGLGQTLIFSQSKGRSYVKRWAAPSNPHSLGQQAMRAATAFLSNAWASLPAPNKLTWNELAAQTNIPPYNAFLAHNIPRLRNNSAPTQVFPATETGSYMSCVDWNSAALLRRGRLRIQTGSMNQGWGILIYKTTSLVGPTDWDRLYHIMQIDAAGWHELLTGILATGIHYFRFRRFTTTGLRAPTPFDFNAITIP